MAPEGVAVEWGSRALPNTQPAPARQPPAQALSRPNLQQLAPAVFLPQEDAFVVHSCQEWGRRYGGWQAWTVEDQGVQGTFQPKGVTGWEPSREQGLQLSPA